MSMKVVTGIKIRPNGYELAITDQSSVEYVGNLKNTIVQLSFFLLNYCYRIVHIVWIYVCMYVCMYICMYVCM